MNEAKTLLHAARAASTLNWRQLALVIDTSHHAVTSWLKGARNPAGPARLLLELIAEGPEHWPGTLTRRIIEARRLRPAAHPSTKHPPGTRLATRHEHDAGACARNPRLGIMACVYCPPPLVHII